MPGCAGNETREAGEVAWPLEEQQAELNGQQAMTRPDGKAPHRFLPSHSILLMERVISSRLSERDGGSELSDGSDMEAFTAMGLRRDLAATDPRWYSSSASLFSAGVALSPTHKLNAVLSRQLYRRLPGQDAPGGQERRDRMHCSARERGETFAAAKMGTAVEASNFDRKC